MATFFVCLINTQNKSTVRLENIIGYYILQNNYFLPIQQNKNWKLQIMYLQKKSLQIMPRVNVACKSLISWWTSSYQQQQLRTLTRQQYQE